MLSVSLFYGTMATAPIRSPKHKKESDMRKSTWLAGVVFALSVAGVLSAQPGGQKGKDPPAVQELLEDDAESLIRVLNNDGSLDGTQARPEFREFYAGVSSLRVTPFQRF